MFESTWTQTMGSTNQNIAIHYGIKFYMSIYCHRSAVRNIVQSYWMKFAQMSIQKFFRYLDLHKHKKFCTQEHFRLFYKHSLCQDICNCRHQMSRSFQWLLGSGCLISPPVEPQLQIVIVRCR